MSMKRKSGLHKEISSIFSGVPLPNNNADRNTAINAQTTDKTAGHIPPTPPVSPKPPQISAQDSAKAEEKPQKVVAPAPAKTAAKPEKTVAPAPAKEVEKSEKAVEPAPAKEVEKSEKTVEPTPAREMEKPEKAVAHAPHRGGTNLVNMRARLKGFLERLDPLWQQVKSRLLTPPEGVSQAKHMTTLVSVLALFLVAMFIFGRLLLKSGMKGGDEQRNDLSGVSVVPRTEPEWQRPSVYPVGLRDPMRKSSEQGFSLVENTDDVETTDIVVRGIVWSEDNPAAVIGTEIIYQGQVVSGVTIVKIEKDSVEFEKNGKKWTQKVAD